MKKLLSFTAGALICAALFAGTPAPALNIIPEPESVVVTKGSLNIKGLNFNYDSSLEARTIEAIGTLSSQIYICTGKASSCASVTGVTAATPINALKGAFFLKDATMAPESYALEVSKKAVKVTAADHNGFLYAISTLKQLMPEAIYESKTASGVKWTVPCCSIKDAPRFAYRGLHLDVARHFFNVEQVKRFLDVAAMYKVNRFHWHLTEDQGWRIEIKKYPRLTEVGAFRSATQQTYDRSKTDGKRYGGYYTQEQMREVVAYAEKLGITVIPEFDLPGHTVAALTSYPWLGCTGGPYEVRTIWGIAKEVLCAGKESTFQFLFDVLDEICDIFPSEYIHIGGDECPKDAWKVCPACQAKIAELGLKDGNGATKEQRLQNYVTKRVQDYLAGKGRKIIGWDEILEGDLAKGATVMSWRGTKGGEKAAAMGFDVIMSPNTYCYFDYQQDAEPKDVVVGYPLRKGREPLTSRKVYSYEPYEGLSGDAPSHILGVQANVWTEYIRNNDDLDYQLLPRLQALSEVQWSKPGNKNYDRFVEKMDAKHFKIMKILGYGYRPGL